MRANREHSGGQDAPVADRSTASVVAEAKERIARSDVELCGGLSAGQEPRRASKRRNANTHSMDRRRLLVHTWLVHAIICLQVYV